jgi:energy-coupling factor transporter transmembrane protein EcfT
MFLLRFLLLLSLPNNVWRLIVFAPFLIIIKSPKQRLGDLLFLFRFLLLFLLLLLFSFFSFLRNGAKTLSLQTLFGRLN